MHYFKVRNVGDDFELAVVHALNSDRTPEDISRLVPTVEDFSLLIAFARKTGVVDQVLADTLNREKDAVKALADGYEIVDENSRVCDSQKVLERLGAHFL